MSRRHLPAESSPQSGVMLAWPHALTDWKDSLDEIDAVYREMAHAIARHEILLVICRDETHRKHIEEQLGERCLASATVRFYTLPVNDTWTRDYGPITVVQDGRPALLDFVFNGWGQKYPAGLDNEVSQTLFARGAFAVPGPERVPLVLEGGSIDTDGAGTLLTTSRCLLSPARNPGMDKEDLAAMFRDLLGIDRVLWLDHGELAGDDTDSHIDMLARFCDPDTIVYTHCSDPEDVHHAELCAMEAQLGAFRTAHNRPYDLHPLPLPAPVVDARGKRLPASYANFLVINAAVLVPVYEDPADQCAAETLGHCFPGREIIPVNCRALIGQSGSLHCATMQLPEGVLRDS